MKMPKNNKMFVFDVDGTLTPSRQKIDEEFKKFFNKFFESREYCLVSGSDYKKLQEQVDDDILNSAKYVFACAGNSIWVKGLEIYNSNWQPSSELIVDLENALANNTYDVKSGNHIEIRTGLVNFSFIGRNCTQEQRDEYVKWDNEHSERLWLVLNLRKKYPDLTFEIGGQISIDIYPKGKDKSQILEYLNEYTIYFFGDGIEPGKNDWSLAQALHGDSKSFKVTDWMHTEKILFEYNFDDK